MCFASLNAQMIVKPFWKFDEWYSRTKMKSFFFVWYIFNSIKAIVSTEHIKYICAFIDSHILHPAKY